MIDLHLHTTASDGVWTPEELLVELKKAGIEIFAITDHDTIANIGVMKELVKDDDVRFIPGCEVACMFEGIQHHITSYGFEIGDNELQKVIEKNHKERSMVDKLTVNILHERGHYFDIDAFEGYTYDPKRGGWPALNFLIDQGVVKDIHEFFKVIPPEIKFKFHTPKQVIDAVHASGGTAILAHPNAYNKGERLPKDQLLKWKSLGIDGIECFTPYNKDGDAEYYVEFCKAHDLYISGGSDCHGGFVGRQLGKPSIMKEDLNLPFL